MNLLHVNISNVLRRNGYICERKQTKSMIRGIKNTVSISYDKW